MTIDASAKAAYVVNGATWIGTDVPQTIYMKILAARELGLGGLMVGESWWVGGGGFWRGML